MKEKKKITAAEAQTLSPNDHSISEAVARKDVVSGDEKAFSGRRHATSYMQGCVKRIGWTGRSRMYLEKLRE